MPLQIIIVGAGISGLCAAVSLRQAGHKVNIFEKSKCATEVGAALNCAPNGALALQNIGFDFSKAKGVKLDNWETVDGISLKKLQVQDISQADQRLGASFRAVHRVDLFQELLSLATNKIGGEQDVELHLGTKVVAIDTEKGSIELEDGTRKTADVIVAADGVHSVVRSVVVGDENQTSIDTGMSAFRFLVPSEVLEKSPEALRLLTQKASGASLYADTTDTANERHLMWYACRGGELHNFVGIHPKRIDAAKSGWFNTITQLLDEFGHFDPDIVATLRLGEDVSSWPLFAHKALPTWTRGKAILLGDAAHPMLPFGGQGANQAIEDGVSLGVFLRGVEDAAQISQRLQSFVDFRYRRVSRVQLLSSVRAGNESKVVEQIKQYMEPGVLLPDAFPKRVQHDAAYAVVLEAERYLAKPDSVRMDPVNANTIPIPLGATVRA